MDRDRCLDILEDADRLPLAHVDLISHNLVIHSSFSFVSGFLGHKLLNIDPNQPTHQNSLDMQIDSSLDSLAIYHCNRRSNGMHILQGLLQGIAWFWFAFRYYR